MDKVPQRSRKNRHEHRRLCGSAGSTVPALALHRGNETRNDLDKPFPPYSPPNDRQEEAQKPELQYGETRVIQQINSQNEGDLELKRLLRLGKAGAIEEISS